MQTPSLRARLALVHFAVIIVVLALAAIAGRWSLSKAMHGQLDAALLALAETEMAMLATEPGHAVSVHEIQAGPAPPSLVRIDRLVQIVDAQGAVLARSSNLGAARLPCTAPLLARLASGEIVFQTLPAFGDEPVRMVSVPVRGPGMARAVQVAGSLDDVNHVVASASTLFVVLTIVLLATVGTTGTLLTRRVFRAIDSVVEQARRIGNGSLSERLPHPGTLDEIGALVETLNAMLARLEQGFETQRHFTADASHELRSPLSRLRAELEVTLRRPRDSNEYVEALRSCLGEVERLTQLVEELLLLARLDASQEREADQAANLNAVVEEVIARMQPRAAELGVTLHLQATSALQVHVLRSHLGLICTNLLDNAIKFSPRSGQVRVNLLAEGEDALLSISDDGPGIDEAEMPQLFERFFRGSRARAQDVPGTGLGLALSHAIARAYGGRIDASNRVGGGTLFVVRLPRSVA